MRCKKILITGSNGYIGSNLEDHLKSWWQVFSTDLTPSKKANFFSADISHSKEISNVVAEVHPNIIIHTAGISSLARCEKNPVETRLVNVVGTRNIIRAINKVDPKIKLVFLSSDYVFDGLRGDYSEKDVPHPRTLYGKSKLQSEKDIQKNLANYVIIRSANVYGRGGNFFNFLVQNLQDLRKEEYFNDSFYTPTHIDHLLNASKILIDKNFKGLIHIVGKEKVSRFDFALKVAEALGKDPSLIVGSAGADSILLSKDCSLNSDLSSKILSITCPSISESLKLLFNFNTLSTKHD